MLKKYLPLSILLLLTLIFTPYVFAQHIERQEIVLLPKDQVVNQDYFATGEKVTIAGIVNGDAYIAGGNLIIDGEINGDLLAAGGTVNIRGRVTDDVRVAAGQVIISGLVEGNVTVLGGSVNLENSAEIKGSLTSAAGNLSVFSPIGKGITAGAGDITIDSKISGNILTGVNSLTLNPNAEVNGNLTYVSERQANIQPGAKVSGKTTHNLPQKPQEKDMEKILGGIFLFFEIISFLAALIMGMLLLKFFPNYIKDLVNYLDNKPLKSTGLGLLTAVVTPILIILLFITLVGIPASLMLLAAFLVSLYFSKIIFAMYIGQKATAILGRKWTVYLSFLTGLMILYLFKIIPVVGFITTIVAVLAGTGAIVQAKFSILKLSKSKKII
ncbi:hypothetical protein A3A49_01420 [Candidatus Curtissbacteria bacterium RIFCSPLOWO2_01_FULL_38_11b]|uniref:DUF8173 domain-containing protein n=1 Tax=Candidatus Curtissbacteria bacterium RIFCSPLOWO2_01_FULL_38_11b TaxID=1797725 RepID=A0A1F5H2S5_9BACT|nr:MAG: hypothetical protein A3A49_01420 [Candidatus Curtissbacteria bacterium RIFCSPLOWO2_01_FULL_38_11b]